MKRSPVFAILAAAVVLMFQPSPGFVWAQAPAPPNTTEYTGLTAAEVAALLNGVQAGASATITKEASTTQTGGGTIDTRTGEGASPGLKGSAQDQAAKFHAEVPAITLPGAGGAGGSKGGAVTTQITQTTPETLFSNPFAWASLACFLVLGGMIWWKVQNPLMPLWYLAFPAGAAILFAVIAIYPGVLVVALILAVVAGAVVVLRLAKTHSTMTKAAIANSADASVQANAAAAHTSALDEVLEWAHNMGLAPWLDAHLAASGETEDAETIKTRRLAYNLPVYNPLPANAVPTPTAAIPTPPVPRPV